MITWSGQFMEFSMARVRRYSFELGRKAIVIGA